MEESVFVDGIVFRKNVSHKKMMYYQNEDDPKILLLSGGIDFQRMDMKLSSMDTLIEQEDKYMEILVEKIMSLKPGKQFIIMPSVCLIDELINIFTYHFRSNISGQIGLQKSSGIVLQISSSGHAKRENTFIREHQVCLVSLYKAFISWLFSSSTIVVLPEPRSYHPLTT
jgi:hypothetical protein